MDLTEFRHQSDSSYCFSINENTVVVRLAVAKRLSLSSVDVLYNDSSLYYKSQYREHMHIAHEDETFFYYETRMKVKIPRFFYIFHISGEGSEVFYSESGLTPSYNFNLAFLSAFSYNGENCNDYGLAPKSWQGRLVYQVFPERFACRGNPKEKPYVNRAWDSEKLKLNHQAFLGGDLWGLVDKLDYLHSLGVGVLYMTPVHPSPSNHKYDVLDYFDIDPNFGGKEAFMHLINKAHELGMKVMMDLVFNHMSSSHPFFLDVIEKGRASKYFDWFFIDGDKPTKSPLNYRCFSFVSSMPKLNTNNPEVRDYLISVGKYWIEEFGVDGYRLDVADAVSHDFWIRFKIALKDIHPDVLLIGENWHNSESFVGPDQLDGVMNYPFLGAVSCYLLQIKNAYETRLLLDGLLMRYKDSNNHMMLNILSSHDVQRFMNLVRCDKNLVLMGFAMLMFYPGFPMVYYGEELFMEGGADPDNRRGMAWERVGGDDFYIKRFAEIMRLRKHESLKKGEICLKNIGDMLEIRRYTDGETLVLYLNRTDNPILVPNKGEEVLSNHYAGGTLYSKGFLVQKEK